MYVMCVNMVMEQVCQQFQEIMEEEECDDETLCVLPQVRGGVLDCLQEELAWTTGIRAASIPLCIMSYQLFC